MQRLEGGGLLQKDQSATDRRASMARLTDAGREALEGAAPSMSRRFVAT
ncbi:hypothetical protein [Streptomyces sp. 7N604]